MRLQETRLLAPFLPEVIATRETMAARLWLRLPADEKPGVEAPLVEAFLARARQIEEYVEKQHRKKVNLTGPRPEHTEGGIDPERQYAVSREDLLPLRR
jgi:hypothetical protein